MKIPIDLQYRLEFLLDECRACRTLQRLNSNLALFWIKPILFRTIQGRNQRRRSVEISFSIIFSLHEETIRSESVTTGVHRLYEHDNVMMVNFNQLLTLKLTKNLLTAANSIIHDFNHYYNEQSLYEHETFSCLDLQNTNAQLDARIIFYNELTGEKKIGPSALSKPIPLFQLHNSLHSLIFYEHSSATYILNVEIYKHQRTSTYKNILCKHKLKSSLD